MGSTLISPDDLLRAMHAMPMPAVKRMPLRIRNGHCITRPKTPNKTAEKKAAAIAMLNDPEAPALAVGVVLAATCGRSVL